MTAAPAFEETIVDRAELRASGGEATALRQGAGGLIERSEFTSPGLPPSAVLIVRRLRCNVPGTRDGWPQALAQGLDLREAMAALARQAGRPDREVVGDDVPAVLFPDKARMLACLASDLVKGSVARTWWWRVPLRRLAGGWTGPAAVADVLASEPAVLPAAIADLAASGRLPAVLAAMPTAAPARLSAALAAAHGLDGLARRLSRAARPAEESDGPRALAGALEILLAGSGEASSGLEARIARIAPEALQVGGDAESRLAALALLLHRHPDIPRAQGFAETLMRPRAQWYLPAGAPHRRTVAGDAGYARPHPAIGHDGRWAAPSENILQDFGRRAVHPPAPPAPSPSPSMSAAEKASAPGPRVEAAGQGGADGIVSPPAVQKPAQGPPAATPANAEALGDDTAVLVEGCPTRLAGTFFLVNVMEALGLPACFEPDWPLAQAVGHWGVLTALARAFAQDLEDSEVEHDPVWTVLEGLCPEPWPQLLNVRAPLVVPEGWRAWLPVDRDTAPPAPAGAAVQRWVRFVHPLLRRRVAMALGVEEEAAAHRLLRHDGRIHVGGPHVDVVIAIADADISVRLAGLDRDPGWCRGFGRVILFHYR